MREEFRRINKEISTGMMVRLDKNTHDRLVNIAKDDDTYQDLINRLVDIAAASAQRSETLSTNSNGNNGSKESICSLSK